MREILFRGKRTDGGGWIHGDLVTSKNGERLGINPHFQNIGRFLVIPETVGQYTGLVDRNGKKIFEGDIVQNTLLYDHDIGRVEYSTEDVGSCGCCFPRFQGAGFKAGEVDLTRCEIIGNIHDDPELLEET